MGRAKDFSSYRYNEMPTADGVLIVESGSNTDGEWIRFADGTQICYLSDSVLNTGFYSEAYGYRCPFPMPFIEEPSSHGTFTQTGGDIRNIIHSSIYRGYNANRIDVLTEWGFLVKFSSHSSIQNITSGLNSETYCQAFGRWK